MTAVRRVSAALLVALAVTLGQGASLSAREQPVVPDTRPITVTTAPDGVGTHPTLRWKPVKGVTTYAVFVQSTKGAPYWSARTPGTHVRLGGGTDSAALRKKRIWFVLGLDAAGAVVASSAKRPIGP